jgi:hypothetical protein
VRGGGGEIVRGERERLAGQVAACIVDSRWEEVPVRVSGLASRGFSWAVWGANGPWLGRLF